MHLQVLISTVSHICEYRRALPPHVPTLLVFPALLKPFMGIFKNSLLIFGWKPVVTFLAKNGHLRSNKTGGRYPWPLTQEDPGCREVHLAVFFYLIYILSSSRKNTQHDLDSAVHLGFQNWTSKIRGHHCNYKVTSSSPLAQQTLLFPY